MLRNRYALLAGLILLLLLGNGVNYFLWSWGLVTINVTNAPLAKVIKSIEWQGWVKIYSNLPAGTTVTMYVDHVPLAEAMETLAVNCTMPRADGADGAGGQAPAAGGAPGADDGRRRGGGGGGGGGFGGGGFGGGGRAQWKLGFFVGQTSSQVKHEILSFEAGNSDDDTKVYSYMTPLGMLASPDSDADSSAADPRSQNWPGLQAVTPGTPAASSTDPNAPPPPANDPPTSVQGYLKAFAQGADIWIMAPGAWDPSVSVAPAASSSISSALQRFIRRANGTMTQALVLTTRGRGPQGGGGPGRGDTDWSVTETRVRNAVNGLPSEARTSALAQLDQEAKFRQQVESAPPDQRRTMMREHMRDKMMAGDAGWRQSPDKRAQMFQHIVNNRLTAEGKK